MTLKQLNARVYTISYSIPKEDGEHWSKHGCIRVLAQDLTDAVFAIRKAMPNAKVWTCAHQGAISLFSDAALVSLCMETDLKVLGVLVNAVAEKPNEVTDNEHH